MENLGPPWQYIEPKMFYTFAAIMGFIAAILIVLIIAFFINKFFKYRHEIKIARIQSGNLDPMQTQAGAFLILRRGLVIMFCGINIGFSASLDSPVPLAFLPFTLGLAYIIIYFIHIRGILKLFPENGKKTVAAPVET
jgi:ABC-type phosphate transport system permease subunit